MAGAELKLHRKRLYDDGAILEMKLWQLPEGAPVRGSAHRFKYSLFYGRPGERIVAYDNEAGKGDHVHRGAEETPYRFESVETLVRDFMAEVSAHRGGRS